MRKVCAVENSGAMRNLKYYILSTIVIETLLLAGCDAGNNGANNAYSTDADYEQEADETEHEAIMENDITADISNDKYQLMALVDSREEAQELAALYGVDFVNYSYGVATFSTEEEPDEVIKRGAKNGWKPLEEDSGLELQ